MEIFMAVFLGFFAIYMVSQFFSAQAERRRRIMYGLQTQASSKVKVDDQVDPVKAEVVKLVWHDVCVNVSAAPLKVQAFIEGKVEGRLVMHGPHEGVVKRIFWTSKDGKSRSFKLEPLYGINTETVNLAYAESLDEVKKIVQTVYAKKQKAKAVVQKAVTTAPQPKVEVAPVVVAASVPVVSAQPAPVIVPVQQPAQAPAQNGVSEIGCSSANEPITHGFKSQVVGTLVSAKMETHVSSWRGESREYSSYTLTVLTDSGLERIVGNDLRRAIEAAGCKPGEKVRVIHIKDVEINSPQAKPGEAPAKPRYKKQFTIVRLNGSAEH